MNLVIAEKPSVAQSLATVIGATARKDGYLAVSYTHLDVYKRQGLLYCADCGGKMYVHRTNNGKRVSQYTCSNYTKVPCGTLCPTQHRINESAVLTLVSDTLRAIAEYSKMCIRDSR